MSSKKEIEGTIDAWEDGTLGETESTAVLSDLTIDDIQSAAGLKSISIRMRESLIDDLKLIADIEGLGYQPLIKQVLQRFVDCELKNYARKTLVAKAKQGQARHEEQQAKKTA